MASRTELRAKLINHGQSEIWLLSDGQEVTNHRTLATNEIFNVVRCHTAEDVFKAFYTECHIALEYIASLDVTDLDVIAVKLKLET